MPGTEVRCPIPLLPCPFCGGEAQLEEIDSRSSKTGAVAFSAGCHNEGCIGYQSMSTYARRTEAANAWNKRTTPDGD
jgi:hypothetical protein